MTKPLFVKDDTGVIVVEPGVIYPHYLGVIGHGGPITQSALETARYVFTEDCKQLFGGFVHIRILKDEKYRLANFDVGEGVRRLDVRPVYDNLPGTAATRLGIL
jgi:hypothetical protein